MMMMIIIITIIIINIGILVTITAARVIIVMMAILMIAITAVVVVGGGGGVGVAVFFCAGLPGWCEVIKEIIEYFLPASPAGVISSIVHSTSGQDDRASALAGARPSAVPKVWCAQPWDECVIRGWLTLTKACLSQGVSQS